MKQRSPIHFVAGICEAIAPDAQCVRRKADRRGILRIPQAAPVHRLNVHAPERPNSNCVGIRAHVVAIGKCLPAGPGSRFLALSFELFGAQILQTFLAFVQIFRAQQMTRPSLERHRRNIASATIFLNALTTGVPGRNVVRPVRIVGFCPGKMTHRRRPSTAVGKPEMERESAAHFGMAGCKPHPHIARDGNHRRSSASRTRASACGSNCASTRIRRRLRRSIPIGPFPAAGNCRIRRTSSEGGFFRARFYRRGNRHRRKTWHDPLGRPCPRRQVNTTLTATPLRRAAPWQFGGTFAFLNITESLRSMRRLAGRREASPCGLIRENAAHDKAAPVRISLPSGHSLLVFRRLLHMLSIARP
jgi:hypothetical protein